jgi:hypothetical protein
MVSVYGLKCPSVAHANCTKAATYSAFCQKYGDHSTNAVGPHNWNEEVIERMVRDLSAPWQGLRSILRSRNDRTVLLIDDLMDWAIQYLGKL